MFVKTTAKTCIQGKTLSYPHIYTQLGFTLHLPPESALVTRKLLLATNEIAKK